MSYRPLTDGEMSDLSKALHDDDPIVRHAVVGVIAGAIETSGRGRAYATAFQAALEPPEILAGFSELDGLFACVFDGVCGHARSPAELELSTACVLISACSFSLGHVANGAGLGHALGTFIGGLVFASCYGWVRTAGWCSSYVATATAHATNNFLLFYLVGALLPG